LPQVTLLPRAWTEAHKTSPTILTSSITPEVLFLQIKHFHHTKHLSLQELLRFTMSSAPINESHLADMSKQQTDGTIEILTPQMVSEAAKAEDGPKKDSHAAALQSQLSKQQNNDNNSQGPKQQTDGDSITLDQVKVTPKMISEAAKAEGGPTKGSHAAALQSQFSKQQASKNNTSDGPGSQNNTSNGTSSQDSENNSLDGTGSSNNNGAASHNTSASLETRVHSLESTLPFRTVKPV